MRLAPQSPQTRLFPGVRCVFCSYVTPFFECAAVHRVDGQPVHRVNGPNSDPHHMGRVTRSALEERENPVRIFSSFSVRPRGGRQQPQPTTALRAVENVDGSSSASPTPASASTQPAEVGLG